ncbi:hypothetical protein V1511DRAFT_421415 [Dipodascopsis uninucleata]
MAYTVIVMLDYYSAEKQLARLTRRDERSQSPASRSFKSSSPRSSEVAQELAHIYNIDEDSALVYVHSVRMQDTIAAVQIRYNISSERIRRANRLWSNDSIHSRAMLFVPVAECDHDFHLIDLHPHDIPKRLPSYAVPFGTAIIDDSVEVLVCIVPIRQLGFFPPSQSSTPTQLSPISSI